MRVSEAFNCIVEYGLAIGMKDLADRPGLWEAQIDDQWFIAVNPHKETLECSRGPKVPFGNAYVEFNGWPAGFITPYGGVIAAGKIANEGTFIEALYKATKAVA